MGLKFDTWFTIEINKSNFIILSGTVLEFWPCFGSSKWIGPDGQKSQNIDEILYFTPAVHVSFSKHKNLLTQTYLTNLPCGRMECHSALPDAVEFSLAGWVCHEVHEFGGVGNGEDSGALPGWNLADQQGVCHHFVTQVALVQHANRLLFKLPESQHRVTQTTSWSMLICTFQDKLRNVMLHTAAFYKTMNKESSLLPLLAYNPDLLFLCCTMLYMSESWKLASVQS